MIIGGMMLIEEHQNTQKKTLTHCQIVHRKSHTDWHGMKPGLSGGSPASNSQKHIMVCVWNY